MSRASSTSAESDAFDDEGSEVKDAEQGANDKANVEHLDHTTRIAMHSGSVILPPQSPKPAKPSACRSTTPTTPHHPLSPTASALLADSDREEPPVPPGLLKKKHRWSLGLLAAPQRTSTGTQREGAGGQRRSATADHARRGDTSAQNNDIYDGAAEYFDVSPGSCTSESSSCSAASDALHALHISDSDTLQGSDTEPSKLGEEGEVKEVEEVEGEAVDLTARSALVG
ncbi:hypothetical protein EYR36_001723 [Pleurotus pulmonarius]|nr:hypothetical protein EYR36_001723 [Pleurotus pulmonarius]